MDKLKNFFAKCYLKVADWYYKIPNWGQVALSAAVFAAVFFALIGFVNLANC